MAVNKASDKPMTLIKNAATAPVIFVDSAPTYGALNDVVEITLAARLLMPRSDGQVAVELAAQAHLRCSVAGALALRQAIDSALDMVSKQKQEIKLAS